jgi:hypothetical protein
MWTGSHPARCTRASRRRYGRRSGDGALPAGNLSYGEVDLAVARLAAAIAPSVR